MPYTAPLKPLLSAQHIEFSDPIPEARPERPRLNCRSYSSTSYVRRHRRSPSICKPTVQSSSEPVSRSSPSIDPHASLRQSPPPLNNAVIPPGAVISPPESALNSSDDESPYQGGQGIRLEDLEAAVRSIEQRRESSPERSMGPTQPTANEARSSSSLPLSREARKIAHSRSSTEDSIILKREEALTSSPEDSDVEFDSKPPMVRKKSGELVRPALRPASARRRPSSMPGTPVYSKAVHFDAQLEHIRHFLQLDKPLAVSAETSPVESHDTEGEFPFGRQAEPRTTSWEWDIRLSNFPTDVSLSQTRPVRLERLFLSSDKNVLIGTVAVSNLAFHKQVAARFTFDHWRTVSEMSASFCHDVRRKHTQDGYDRFTFDIKLNDQTNLECKTMSVCVRYSVNGQEFWDNNNAMNYQVDFIKTPKTTPSKPPSGPRPSLPRSRSFTGSHSSRPRSMPPSFDDFPEIANKVAFSDPFPGANGAPLTRKASDDLDTVAPPKPREKHHRQAFGTRYDFGASLSAAMRTKTPLDRTTLAARARSGQTAEENPARKSPDIALGMASPVSDDICDGARVGDAKPSSLVSSKPRLESSVYRELVDRYCFYGSSQGVNQTPPAPVSTARANDTEHAKLSPPSAGSAPSPPLSPRSLPAEPSPAEKPREARPASTSLSPRNSPRTSPSPKSFRYPYHHQNSFMNEPPSSPVIRG
ncbi:uncharacterized protein PFLUO_LOCUS2331 [Penicillium psychrofluorescens]|uniref:uncharacterized protein n=1 Tax=Penicillium psychrofluorescens TaxID=3158075 RepID=UPI003CCDE1F2